MKSPYVEGLVPNELVTGHFLVLSKEIRQKKTGEPYLSLHLSDRTGEVEAKMWDAVAEVMDTFDRDDFVKVKGVPQVYQSRTQFTIHRLRRVEDHEVDFADYFPCSERDSEQMFSELLGIIGRVKNAHLRSVLTALFEDKELAARYKIAPAAKSIHHACRGGLLEHVLSLLELARLVAPHYPEVDLDLLTAGVILHDIGKVEELRYERSFNYTSDGQLLGHIIIGLRILADKLARLPDFPSKLRTLLEHMIISHHGELEFGSPKVPQFAEALLLHHLDNLDSKMAAMKNALKRDTQDGEYTGWVNSLERSLLRKDRYLGTKPTTVVQPPAAVPAAAAVSPVAPAAPAAAATPAPKPAVAPEPHPPAIAVEAPPRPAVPEPPKPAPLPPQPVVAPAAASSFPARPAMPQHPAAPLPPQQPTPAAPAPPRAEHRPSAPTLFGEKLQAVLESRK